MIKKIDKLILGSFLKIFVLMFVLVAFLLFMMTMMTSLESIAGKNIGFLKYLKLTLYTIGINSTMGNLPIAVLIASLLTFKSFEESRELVAIKCAGISVMRILQPITIFMIFITFFALIGNMYIVPKSNKDLWSLVYNIQKVNPILNIKPGVFYNELEGYSIKVNKKLPDEKSVEDIIIYDHTKNKGNVFVTIAESGQIYLSGNEKLLIVELKNGHSYVEKSMLDDQKEEDTTYKFIRTKFKEQKITLNLTELDPFSGSNPASSWAISKSTPVLIQDAKKLEQKLKILKNSIIESLKKSFSEIDKNKDYISSKTDINTNHEGSLLKKLLPNYSKEYLEIYINDSIEKAKYIKVSIENLKNKTKKFKKKIRRHLAQAHMHFSLALSGLIVFFIGAPLGIMTRKGNATIAALISISVIGIYYFVAQVGVVSWAPDGSLPPMLGAWFANLLILPFSIFFTYKAYKDETIMDYPFIYKTIEKIKSLFKKNKSKKIK